MIGYHYTTQEAWEQIQYRGLQPAPIRQHEYDSFTLVIPRLPRDAIWVWKEKLTDLQAFIILVTLAEIHRSFEVVLLRVEYEESSAASIAYDDTLENESIRLRCGFAAGRMSTGKLPMELILDDVPASCITKLWEANLLEPFRDRHMVENELVLV